MSARSTRSTARSTLTTETPAAIRNKRKSTAAVSAEEDAADTDQVASEKPTSAAAAAASASVTMDHDSKRHRHSAESVSSHQQKSIESDRVSPLNGLTISTVGHLFLSSNVASSHMRPSLPLVLLLSIVDYLSVHCVVCDVAAISRCGYASVVAYAQLVRGNMTREKMIPSVSDDASSSSNITPDAPMIGIRTDSSNLTSLNSLTLLLASRLRFIVTDVTCKDSFSYFCLTSSHLTQMADGLPQLRSLDVRLQAYSTSPTKPIFRLPSHLRQLTLSILLPLNCPQSRNPKDKRILNWTTNQCDEYFIHLMQSIATQLVYLEELHYSLATQRGLGVVQPRGAWIEPLQSLKNLHTISLLAATKCLPQLRALPSLTKIATFGGGGLGASLKELLQQPHAPRIEELPLHQIVLFGSMREPLLNIRDSLKSLCPSSWNMIDVSWLNSFTRLESISFIDRDAYESSLASTLVLDPPIENIVATLAHSNLSSSLTSLRVADP